MTFDRVEFFCVEGDRETESEKEGIQKKKKSFGCPLHFSF